MQEDHPPLREAHSLVRRYRTFVSGLTASVRPLGLSADGSLLVILLSEKQGPSNTEIAATLGLNLATVTKIVDRLVSDGLVFRRADAVDRRRIQLHLSAEGRDAARQAIAALSLYMSSRDDDRRRNPD